jgi:hypothetical protein
MPVYGTSRGMEINYPSLLASLSVLLAEGLSKAEGDGPVQAEGVGH